MLCRAANRISPGSPVADCVGGTFAAAGCSSPGDDPGPALPVEPAALYAQMCARCHGADGRGDPELKKTLPVRDFSDATFQARASTDEIARTIMAGKNQMPAFGALLSHAEDSVAVRVREAAGADGAGAHTGRRHRSSPASGMAPPS